VAINELKNYGIDFCEALSDYQRAEHDYELASDKLALKRQLEEINDERRALQNIGPDRERKLEKMHERINKYMALKVKIARGITDFRVRYRYEYLRDVKYELDTGSTLGELREVSTVLPWVTIPYPAASQRLPNQLPNVPIVDFIAFALQNHSTKQAAEMIQELKKAPHMTTVTFTPDIQLPLDPENCHRLRVKTFSIKFCGVTPRPNTPGNAIHIRLSCNGEYLDILQGPAASKVIFIGNPMSVLCKHSAEGDPNSTQVAHLDGGPYLPSLYTTWTIRIINPNDFNLEGLSVVDISCSGKAILEEKAA
jgi:hypothetical protein